MDWSLPVVVLLVGLAAVLVALLGTALVLLVKLIRMASQVRSDLMPLRGKVAYWAAIVYTVFPVDLLPDPVYLDDIGVLAGAIAYIGQLARRHGVAAEPASRPSTRA